MDNLIFIEILTAPNHRSFSDFISEDLDGARLFTKKFFDGEHGEKPDPEATYSKYASFHSAFGKIISVSLGLNSSGGENQIKTIVGEEEYILQELMAILNKDKFSSTIKLAGNSLSFFTLPWIVHKFYKYDLKIPRVINFQNRKPWEYNISEISEIWKMKSFNTPFSEIAYELGESFIELPDGKDLYDLYNSKDYDKLKDISTQYLDSIMNVFNKIYIK